jgi:hypothetical protein
MSPFRVGLQTESGLANGFIDHLYTRLGTTRISTYKAIAGLHTLQITRAHAKSSQSPFSSHFLATDVNNGDSSASVLTSLPLTSTHKLNCQYNYSAISSQPPLQNSTECTL